MALGGRSTPGLFAPTAERQVVLTTLIDVSPAQFDAIVFVVSRRFHRMRYRVYVTCDPDLTFFHEGRHPVEYLPSTAEQVQRSGGRDWPLFLKERIRLITAKWAPARILSYGTGLEAFIARAPAPPPLRPIR